ncbi:polysaccharide (de)acetylase [Flavobacterium sp.]|uniref:polysaccharide (de)acetylase n=1 Tax=Flavobacterium sp. TaxID=239 RepID=UPI004047D3A2
MINKIIKNLSNLPGWRTDRKIIVIESDDWGSIRMPSLTTFEKLASKGLDVSSGDALRYNTNDTLASANDFSSLYETLMKFKDFKGNHPVITAVSLVANPNFEKIKESNYQSYYWEPFTETLEKYNKVDAFPLWKEGIQNKLFIPQFHGREHLNIAAWMKALQNGDKEALIAFENGMWGYNNKHRFGVMFQAAFDLELISDLEVQSEAIKSGLHQFEKLFGYKATFFVPPNGPFNNSLEKVAAENGIKYMSVSKIQNEVLGEGKTRKKIHYLGQKNKHNQRYITRNCFFEPSELSKDWITSCLADIENAFYWRKPAVISSHRVNFIGGLNENNRKQGLQQLSFLLASILEKWPEVEFMSSNELGDLLSK